MVSGSRSESAVLPQTKVSLSWCWRHFAALADKCEGERHEYLMRHCGRLAWVAFRTLQLTRPGDHVLEAGCAWGDVSAFLAANGRVVTGVDYWHAPHSATGFEFVKCDFERDPLPFPASSFSCVIFTEVLEHFAHSPVPALLELRRVTTADGVIVLSTPNQMSIGHLAKMIRNRSNAFQSLESKLDGEWILNRFHNHVYTRRELKLLCCRYAGLRPRVLRYTSFLPSRGIATAPREFVRFAAGVVPSLRSFLYGEFTPDGDIA